MFTGIKLSDLFDVSSSDLSVLYICMHPTSVVQGLSYFKLFEIYTYTYIYNCYLTM